MSSGEAEAGGSFESRTESRLSDTAKRQLRNKTQTRWWTELRSATVLTQRGKWISRQVHKDDNEKPKTAVGDQGR